MLKPVPILRVVLLSTAMMLCVGFFGHIDENNIMHTNSCWMGFGCLSLRSLNGAPLRDWANYSEVTWDCGWSIRESPPKSLKHSGLGLIVICPDTLFFNIQNPSDDQTPPAWSSTQLVASPSKVGVADATSAMIHAIQFGGAVEQLGKKDGED